ncbi:hypothetical protein [Legionella shakespearei]|uniref:Protein kinase domain-containing protein n=1 Tax=Legionella shakespearei DSM 23087 TaxID=1122169 RepID=A0A0W0Z4Z4_9GAMM|nr:hypothetical protein [Legionella shakespearei]KTD64196.1 hypothetical protein Lsha_0627 [Legionella shakespearei DSM 23087]
MNQYTPITLGPYQGGVALAFDHTLLLSQLNAIIPFSHDENSIVTLGELSVAVKCFRRQYGNRQSKAKHSFLAAWYLQQNHIGAPNPVAWLDLWHKGHLIESYYLYLFEPVICFGDYLNKIYERCDNKELMDLLHTIAPAIRSMHDMGFMHGNLNGEAIVFPEQQDKKWEKPLFHNLNNSKIAQNPLSLKQRAFDLSRINLPGAYRNIFKMIYWGHEDAPALLHQQEVKYRRRWELYQYLSPFRHPVRYFRKKHKKVTVNKQNIWLWDEKTAQPMMILNRKEKNCYRDWLHIITMAFHGVIHLRAIHKRYYQILANSYRHPLSLEHRVGIALHPKKDYMEHELILLKQLGNPPVLLRFCHHESPEDWRKGIDLVHYLHQQNIEVMVAILQDRQAILDLEGWAGFLNTVISAVADKVSYIEVTHASNRVKWGIWSSKEYAQLMRPAFELQKRYPQIKLTGPACIDFDYQAVFAALKTLPKGKRLDALSHFLYVDRRGAPENKQGRTFSLVEKCALLKALASGSKQCTDKVIISEVNWPVKYTGIWSPIGCPYETPKWRREEPGISEEEYANYMLRYIVIALCSGHVEQIFWWRLSAHGYGLVDDRDNFRPRAAFKALAFFLHFLGKAHFIHKHDYSNELYVFEFKTEEQKVIMLWSNDPEPADLPLKGYTQILDKYGCIANNSLVTGSPLYLIFNESVKEMNS